jgi:hypothetical protein
MSTRPLDPGTRTLIKMRVAEMEALATKGTAARRPSVDAYVRQLKAAEREILARPVSAVDRIVAQIRIEQALARSRRRKSGYDDFPEV